jgi:hypothetical protein
MSEQTNKQPDPQARVGEVIPPAAPGHLPVSSADSNGGLGAVPVEPPPVQKTQTDLHHGPFNKEGWVVLTEELPRPTYWPITMAVALTLIAFGIVNSFLIIIIGIVLLIVALVGWIGDVRDEARLRKH